MKAKEKKIPATMAPTSARFHFPVQCDGRDFPNIGRPAVDSPPPPHSVDRFAGRALVAGRRHPDCFKQISPLPRGGSTILIPANNGRASIWTPSRKRERPTRMIIVGMGSVMGGGRRGHAFPGGGLV